MSSAMNEPTGHPDPTRALDLPADEPADEPRPGPDETRVLTDDTPVRPDDTSVANDVSDAGSTRPARRPMRMPTVVVGLVLLVVAGAVLISELTDVTVDPGAVVLALMIGGGVLLIAGARRS